MDPNLKIESLKDALEIILSYDTGEKKSPVKKSLWGSFLKSKDSKFNYEFPFPFGIWFRGLSRGKEYKLIPSAFRIDKSTNSSYRETALFNSFKLYNPEYNQTHNDNLAWLTLMQHYDLPTRLLDWTENILIGLYFAVRSNHLHPGSLYLLNAQRLNRLVRISTSENGLAIPSSIEPQLFSLMAADNKKKELLQNIHYLNLFEKIKLNNPATIDWLKGVENKTTMEIASKMRTAVAFFPQRINSRMQAQQSMFTIHGGKMFESCAEKEKIGTPVSLEELNKKQEPGKQFLQQIIIPAKSKIRILDELRRIGIDERSLYPDIDKQSNYLKKLWQRKIS